MTLSDALPGTLIFVRHAIAIPAEEFDGSDAERPLTAKGRDKGAKVMRALAKLYTPTQLVTSPHRRAADTCELLRRAMGDKAPAPLACEALVPEARWEHWTSWLRTAGFTRGDVVCAFGHEPSIGAFFGRHLGLPGPVAFKKVGVGIVTPATLSAGDLVAFIPPRVLVL